MKKQKSVQKLITFPRELYEMAERRAKGKGVDFADYIRYITIQDASEDLPIEYLTEEQESSLEEGFRDIMEGRYDTFDNVHDLIKHLHKVSDE